MPEKTRALVVVLGRPTAGKSTFAGILEATGQFMRVSRATTRPRRLDDGRSIQCVSIEELKRRSDRSDFVFGESPSGLYLVKSSDIATARGLRKFPIVEVGQLDTALKLLALFPPACTVYLDRAFSTDFLRAELKARGTSAADIEARVNQVAGYRVPSRSQVDHWISNTEGVSNLEDLGRALLLRLQDDLAKP